MGKREIRITFDTNFYVSLLLKSEICALIFDKIINNKDFKVFICKQIISEIFRVSSYPRIQKFVRPEEVFELIDFILLADNIIFIQPRPYKKVSLLDRDDQKVLETAITAKTDYLITRNLKDFQKAKGIKTLKILTPEKFLKIIRII